jgi:hypothetical protein
MTGCRAVALGPGIGVDIALGFGGDVAGLRLGVVVEGLDAAALAVGSQSIAPEGSEWVEGLSAA